MRAVNNGGTEALLAAPFAFPAKLVVFLPATLIKKERPFSLDVFRHTGHRGHLLIAVYCRFAPETQKRPKPDPAVWFRGDFGRFPSI